MIRSMTGYARAEQQGPSGRLSWELRSVNHRYLELQFKLPEEFRPMENDLRQLATQRIGRGKVEAGLRYSRDASAAGALQIDTDRLAAVLSAVERISGQLRTSTAPDPVQVLAWPGVVRPDNAPDLVVPLADAMLLFQTALDDFTATRSREGERTRLYLIERLDAMAALVERFVSERELDDEDVADLDAIVAAAAIRLAGRARYVAWAIVRGKDTSLAAADAWLERRRDHGPTRAIGTNYAAPQG